LPNRWLGCKSDPEQPACKRLKELDGELSKWDKLQKRIDKLSPGKAKRFLSKNKKRLCGYIATYVPETPSDAAMRKTGFFKKKLATAFKQ
jgi:hypothetical protein